MATNDYAVEQQLFKAYIWSVRSEKLNVRDAAFACEDGLGDQTWLVASRWRRWGDFAGEYVSRHSPGSPDIP